LANQLVMELVKRLEVEEVVVVGAALVDRRPADFDPAVVKVVGLPGKIAPVDLRLLTLDRPYTWTLQ